MSESLEELERQAAEIQKKIAKMKSKSDEVIDAFFAELEQPGAYLKWCDSWIIHPRGKYRQETKKSVELSGQWFIPCPTYQNFIPTLMEWKSGGYAVKEFREMIIGGTAKVYHKPGPIMAVVNKSIDSLTDYSTAIESIANKCRKEPSFEWYWPNFNRLKHEQMIKRVIELFDGLIFKRQVRQEASDGYLEYYAFRVVCLEDSSYVIKCSKLHKWFNVTEGRDPLPELTECDLLNNIRLQPYDVEKSKEMCGLIKNRLCNAELATVDEWLAVAAEHRKSSEQLSELKETVRLAIGLEPRKE